MSDLRERLTALGLPWREADPPPSFAGLPCPLTLRLVHPFTQAVPVIQRLRDAGHTLAQAKRVVDALTDTGTTRCFIAEDAGIPGVIHDLAALNVTGEVVI